MDSEYNKVKESKTYVSWIEEISRKQGNTPKFDIYDVTGETKSTLPRFRCILDLTYKDVRLRAEATERSKKEAKHSAAKAMLDVEMKLTPKDYFEINGGAAKAHNPAVEVVAVLAAASCSSSPQLSDSEIGVNPIGDLLDLCDKLSFGPPEYDEKDRVGPPHMPIFECICIVNGEAKSEKAKTKKQAKRRVAHQWLMTLRGRKVTENVEGNTASRTNGIILGESLPQAQLPGFNKLPCSGSLEECSTIVSHKNHLYQKLCGELVNKLKGGECDDEVIKAHGGVQGFLAALGKESKLDISYNDLPCMQDGQEAFLSVVSIKASNRPELDLVMFANGETKEIARELAAKEALEHIEIFVK